MTTWTIYLLRDPDDPNVGYVGQTRRKLQTRVRQHMTEAPRTSNRRARWLRTIIGRGLEPSVESLEICSTAIAANRAEALWIVRCEKRRGMTLTNTAPGGYFVFDEEGRKAALRRALAHPESRKLKGDASRRNWEAKSKAAKDKWLSSFTPDSRRRQGEKMKAKWADPEWRATTLAKHKAAVTNAEELARKSAASRLVANTPEQRSKRSAQLQRIWADPANAEKNKERNRRISEKLTKWRDPCACGRKVWAKGRCQRCDKYFRRTGKERPLALNLRVRRA
jgi:hypothetical protein